MGRRALPKVDRSIEIAGHFAELNEIDSPYQPDGWTDLKGPLHIEVGCGKGLFLLTQSGAYPDHRFLGIEIAKKYARFAAYRLAKYKRSNARIIRGDALRFLDEYLNDQTAATMHVYFPDPWWKERHRPRRIIQPDFVKNVHRVLQHGGELHFWTDVEEYFETACQLIADSSLFGEPVPVSERTATHDMDYQTHFERRMRLNDHPVWRVKFPKVENVRSNG